ncbi:MAG TPA: TolC family protein [Vicinamibacterales bacterium]|nr:TolC family protein [Vicinamibacterales bacterium]
MRFQTVSAALLLVCLGVPDSFAQQDSPANPLTLQAALAAADEHNRTLIAARLGRTADLAGIDVAKQRPNPEASFEAGRDTPHEAFSIGIPLEFGGKRARRVDLANATLARTTADLIVQALDIRRSVRVAYFELVAAATRLQVITALRGFAERTRNAARDRFESGAAPRLEALQAELALAQADNEQEAARGRMDAARADLNTLIGRPPDAAADPTDSFEGGTLPADLARAVAASPDIIAMDREIDEAVARERLAQTLRTPDTTVSGGVLFDSPPEFMYGWKAGVAVTLPIFTRHTADVRVESARVVQLRAQREARIVELTGQATAAAARARAARQRFLRYRDEIIPQARTVESMAEDSYRSGQTGLAAFLQALQAAREIGLLATDAGLEYQSAIADLERALGGSIR